jgi:serine/threonine-protein kinase
VPSREVIESAKALVGATVRGKWKLDALLGVGGSAAVYAATHRNGKRGALKILRRDLAYDKETEQQFLREGYVANLVGHPGAVAMLDDDYDEDGTPFLVMELLEGSTLERIVRKRQSMPLRDVLQITESVLDVLAAAHGQGIVHGDIKPANIFLTTRSEIKLLDFGIAQTGSKKGPHEGFGTPAYMSPEQARREAIDGRTDLWAVGAVMFSLLTGKPPRSAPTPAEEVVKASIEPMPKIHDIAPYVSADLAEVVDRALAFEVANRWKDAATMQQALRLALLLEQASGPAEQSMQVPPPPPSSRGKKQLPEALRLLRHSDSSMPTRRLPVEPPMRTNRVSTYPPGPSTTNRLAMSVEPDPEATEAAPRRGKLRAAIVAFVVLGIGGGVAAVVLHPSFASSMGFAPFDFAGTSSAPAPETEATDGGRPDATLHR